MSIERIQELASQLTTPGLDVRLQLYLIRKEAWEEMVRIDVKRLSGRPLKLYDPIYTIEDL